MSADVSAADSSVEWISLSKNERVSLICWKTNKQMCINYVENLVRLNKWSGKDGEPNGKMIVVKCNVIYFTICCFYWIVLWMSFFMKVKWAKILIKLSVYFMAKMDTTSDNVLLADYGERGTEEQQRPPATNHSRSIPFFLWQTLQIDLNAQPLKIDRKRCTAFHWNKFVNRSNCSNLWQKKRTNNSSPPLS